MLISQRILPSRSFIPVPLGFQRFPQRLYVACTLLEKGVLFEKNFATS